MNNITTKFHKVVMVGFPPMVLEWSINGQYVVTARCIEPGDEPFLKYLQYEWKLKGDHVDKLYSGQIHTFTEKTFNLSNKSLCL